MRPRGAENPPQHPESQAAQEHLGDELGKGQAVEGGYPVEQYQQGNFQHQLAADGKQQGVAAHAGRDYANGASAILALTISQGAYNSEVIRGALTSIPKGQFEACRALGLNKLQTMGRVVIPQAALVAVPALSNSFISLLKDDGSSARKTTVLTAIRLLIEGGYMSSRGGRYNQCLYSSIRPYRQIDDPKSDAYVDRMSRREMEDLNEKEGGQNAFEI